eukprot:scaffold50494_cov64-Phaeocystis_antarctica.AAC.2
MHDGVVRHGDEPAAAGHGVEGVAAEVIEGRGAGGYRATEGEAALVAGAVEGEAGREGDAHGAARRHGVEDAEADGGVGERACRGVEQRDQRLRQGVAQHVELRGGGGGGAQQVDRVPRGGGRVELEGGRRLLPAWDDQAEEVHGDHRARPGQRLRHVAQPSVEADVTDGAVLAVLQRELRRAVGRGGGGDDGRAAHVQLEGAELDRAQAVGGGDDERGGGHSGQREARREDDHHRTARRQRVAQRGADAPVGGLARVEVDKRRVGAAQVVRRDA